MATIKIILDTRSAKAGGTYPLKLRIYQGKKYRDMPLSIFLDLKDWDDSSRQVKKTTPTTNCLITKFPSSTLNEYLSDFGQEKTLKVNDKLTLQFYPVEERLSSPFEYGGSGDGNSGGFVVANIYSHLPFLIVEKEGKIKPYYRRYPTWWLVLIDTIGHGLGQHELGQLNINPPIKTFFDKVILVSPNNPTHGSEVNTERVLYET